MEQKNWREEIICANESFTLCISGLQVGAVLLPKDVCQCLQTLSVVTWGWEWMGCYWHLESRGQK